VHELAGARGGPPYRPHLSLLYARDLPEERKPAIAGALGLALPVTIRIDAAEIWPTSATTWPAGAGSPGCRSRASFPGVFPIARVAAGWVRSVSVAAHRLPASEPATARAGAGDEDKGPRLAGLSVAPRSVAGFSVMPLTHGGQTRATRREE